MRGIGILALVNSLQQKLIFKLKTYRCACEIKPETALRLFFSKRNITFLGKKKRKLENKTSLYYYG